MEATYTITETTVPEAAYIIAKRAYDLFRHENNSPGAVLGENFLEFVEYEYGATIRAKVEKRRNEIIAMRAA